MSSLDYVISAVKVRLKLMRLSSSICKIPTDQFFQIVFAMSPLLALAYVLYSAFESEEDERSKRQKKSDFNLEGHAE